MTIQELLIKTVDNAASDLHLMVGSVPVIRVNGQLQELREYPPLTEPILESLIFATCTGTQKELLITNKEVDYSFDLKDKGRFRVNAYYQKATIAAAFRHIPSYIKSVAELNLPAVLENLSRLPQGFVLVTGPTGNGKSSTLAALINLINKQRAVHIVTIEDPVEFNFVSEKALVGQREMHNDTHSWQIALKSVLREDIDVVLIGEMRDQDTISSALTVAETGHLVFASLHTNSAAQSIDRIIDVFPENQQNQVRQQLANVIEAVISQRLVRTLDGSRMPVVEIMLANPAIRSLIREEKVHMIDNVIATSSELGMQTLEMSLSQAVLSGKVRLEEALAHSLRPNELIRMVRRAQ